MHRALSSTRLSDDAIELGAELERRLPGCPILIREIGRLIRAEVVGAGIEPSKVDIRQFWPGDPTRARLHALARVASSPQIARDKLRRAVEVERLSASLF